MRIPRPSIGTVASFLLGHRGDAQKKGIATSNQSATSSRSGRPWAFGLIGTRSHHHGRLAPGRCFGTIGPCRFVSGLELAAGKLIALPARGGATPREHPERERLRRNLTRRPPAASDPLVITIVRLDRR